MSIVKSNKGKGIEISLSWQNASNGNIPFKAINAGDSYVARALHNNEYIPGKVVEGENCAYICYDSKEIPKYDYQVLVDTEAVRRKGYQWKSTDGYTLPKMAVVGGTDRERPLYVGRAEVNGKILSGKFQPEHNMTYIPYDGHEHSRPQSEVLCFVKKEL